MNDRERDIPEVDLDVESQVEDGDFVSRKVQSKGRIDVPEDYLDGIGVEKGDHVALVFKGGYIAVVEKDIQKMDEV